MLDKILDEFEAREAGFEIVDEFAGEVGGIGEGVAVRQALVLDPGDVEAGADSTRPFSLQKR